MPEAEVVHGMARKYDKRTDKNNLGYNFSKQRKHSAPASPKSGAEYSLASGERL